MTQPVVWCWARFKNWARIIALETAGYSVILKIWLLFSCLHGNWAKLKTWPWLGMLSTLKLVLLLFGNFSWCVLPVAKISLFSTGNFLKYCCSFFCIFCCGFLFQLTQTSMPVSSRVCSRLCMPVWLQPANSFAYIPKGRSRYLSPCYLLTLNPRLNVCIFQPESRIMLKFKPYLQEGLSQPKALAKFGALLYSLLCN